MEIQQLYAKAQLDILALLCIIQADATNNKAWDGNGDPEWVNRGKDGKFGGNQNAENKILGDKNTANLVSNIQSGFQKLSREQKQVAKNSTDLPVFNAFKSSIGKHLSEFSTEAANVYTKCVQDVGNAVDPKAIITSIEKTKKYYNDNPTQLAIDGSKVILQISTGLALAGCLYCAAGSVILASTLAAGSATFSPEILAYSLAFYAGSTARIAARAAIYAISLSLDRGRGPNAITLCGQTICSVPP